MALVKDIIVVTFIAFTALPSLATAATCTSDEQTTVNNVYTNLASSTSACRSLLADSGATSLDYCMNSDCLSALSDATSELPDCTGDDGLDRKTGLQNILAYCDSVNQVVDDSTSASTNENGADTDPMTSNTATAATSVSIVVTQLSVAMYFVAGLL